MSWVSRWATLRAERWGTVVRYLGRAAHVVPEAFRLVVVLLDIGHPNLSAVEERLTGVDAPASIEAPLGFGELLVVARIEQASYASYIDRTPLPLVLSLTLEVA